MVAKGRGHIKSSPSKKEGLSKEKNTKAEKGQVKKGALEEKKGAKKKDKGNALFFYPKKVRP